MMRPLVKHTSSLIRTCLRRFTRNTKGAMAMEFALVMPVLCAMFLGSAGMFDHFQVKQKATVTADSIADLMARAIEIDDAEADNLLNAAELMMGKYASDITVRMSLTGLVYDEDEGKMVVSWVKSYNMSDRYNVDEMLPEDEFPTVFDQEMLVEAYIEFEYRSPLYFLTSSKIKFTEKGLRKPRYVPAVPYLS